MAPICLKNAHALQGSPTMRHAWSHRALAPRAPCLFQSLACCRPCLVRSSSQSWPPPPPPTYTTTCTFVRRPQGGQGAMRPGQSRYATSHSRSILVAAQRSRGHGIRVGCSWGTEPRDGGPEVSCRRSAWVLGFAAAWGPARGPRCLWLLTSARRASCSCCLATHLAARTTMHTLPTLQEPQNAHSHLLSMLLGNSTTVPVSKGKLCLGESACALSGTSSVGPMQSQ